MFEDRGEAGRLLADRLLALGVERGVVLGLPRGGVPVAAQVATALDAPLDVLVARKLGAPDDPEYAIGAISEAGAAYLDERAAARYQPGALADVERAERLELARRVAAYRGGGALDLDGRSVVLVDDGLATGATMIAACRASRALGAARVTVAVPVAPSRWQEAFGREADASVAVLEPERFRAVGGFYRSFPQTTDAEVLAALASAPRRWH